MEYDSILKTVKENNDIEVDDDSFDKSIISYINSSISTLSQLGVGVPGFRVTGDSETWDQYITDIVQLGFVKDYISKHVMLSFNPPRSQFLIKNVQDQLAELTYRLNLQVEP